MLFLQIDIRGHLYVSQATISSTLEYLPPKATSWRLREIKINTILKKKWKLSSTNEWDTGRILQSMSPKALFSMFLVYKLISWRDGRLPWPRQRERNVVGDPWRLPCQLTDLLSRKLCYWFALWSFYRVCFIRHKRLPILSTFILQDINYFYLHFLGGKISEKLLGKHLSKY